MTFFKISFKYSLLIALIGSIVGCKKWVDINYNPNTPVESNVPADQLLAPTLLTTASIQASTANFPGLGVGYEFLEKWMGYWAPAAGSVTSAEESSYNLTNNFGPTLANAFISNNLNYKFLIEKAEKTNQTFYQAIAMIMMSHNFTSLVDIYNNIPYNDALKLGNNIFPEYNDGVLIYEDAMSKIDQAIILIKNSDILLNTKITSADIMFKGNKTKWIKFANTLKLRLLIHQANRADRASYIQNEITKITTEGTGFLGSGENAAVNPGYLLESGKTNEYYNRYGFTSTGGATTNTNRANIIAMNFLKSNSDPRLTFFYKPIQTAVPSGSPEPFSQPLPNNYRGNEFGRPINTAQYPYQSGNYVSKIGGVVTPGPVSTSSSGIIKGYNMDMWVLTSIESLFLQAEAIQRGWINGDAKSAYSNAIKESFLWLNVNGSQAAAITAFSTWYNSQVSANNVNVSWDAASDKYKLLMFQKYLAFNGIAPLEAWTDYRRNNSYPNIPLSADPACTSTKLPVRLLYPKSEYDFNNDNVNTQGTINQFTNKIWWMP